LKRGRAKGERESERKAREERRGKAADIEDWQTLRFLGLDTKEPEDVSCLQEQIKNKH
jgi:hypothetical protein